MHRSGDAMAWNVFKFCIVLRGLGSIMILLVLAVVGITYYVVVLTNYGPALYDGGFGSLTAIFVLLLFHFLLVMLLWSYFSVVITNPGSVYQWEYNWCGHRQLRLGQLAIGFVVDCPAFSSPHRHYMEQTASAKAKVRPKSNPRQRMIPGSRSHSPGGGTESSRRFSFPTTPSISGSSKFRETIQQQGSGGGLHDKVDQLSTGSPTSVTSRNILDRKPFNRFV